jgi:hypothetical protein
LETKGLILGEILGLIAGLTSAELTLFLFFELRPILGSSFLAAPKRTAGLVGDDTALSMGLGLPDMATPAEGVLKGFSLGVFREDVCEFAPSSSLTTISVRDGGGLSNEGSGSVRSSKAGIFSARSAKLGDCCKRINDAGVAGPPPWP